MKSKIIKALILLLLAAFAGVPSTDITAQQKEKPNITQPKDKTGQKKPKKHKKQKKHKKHKKDKKHKKHHGNHRGRM